MSFSDKDQIRDAKGNLLQLQGYEPVSDAFVPARGNSKGLFFVPPPLSGTNYSKAVDVASSQLMPADPARTRYVIQNNGTVNVWLNWGGGAIVGNVACYKLKPGETYRGDGDTELMGIIAEGAQANVFCRAW